MKNVNPPKPGRYFRSIYRRRVITTDQSDRFYYKVPPKGVEYGPYTSEQAAKNHIDAQAIKEDRGR